MVQNECELDHLYASHHDIDEIADRLAHPLVDNGSNVGIVVGVLDADGQRHIYGYGKLALGNAATPDGDTIFAIGSVTKSFVTTLFYLLEKDGVVSSDDKLGDIFPESLGFSPAAKEIRLGQLVNHSSGLARQPMTLAMLGSVLNYSFTGENIYRHLGTEEVYAYLRTFAPEDDDVGHYQYSNMGMGLLGRAVEIKTGRRLEDLLAEKIITPLDLRDTSYTLSEDRQHRLAEGHVGDSPFFLSRNTPVAPWVMDDILKGAAGLHSTANDLLTFLAFRLKIHGIPIQDLPVEGRELFGYGTTGHKRIAYGWEVDDVDDGFDIISQHGMISGYSTYIGLEPRTGVAVVVLCNNFYWRDLIGAQLMNTLIRNGSPIAASHRLQAAKRVGSTSRAYPLPTFDPLIANLDAVGQSFGVAFRRSYWAEPALRSRGGKR